ncbi:hypothetical protein B9Z55_015276 [Caenorhabditis nigoni]|uniref:Uncharacterized protein n=1 Tax=Caenorhabditis nigoni TaxID=1611254 RepID=A0A2G5UA92_9PELO|nr:hypothetical protein B9Z55_015276 [Caenorhabditis nigoni]
MYSPPTSTYQLYIKEVKDHDETRKMLERAVNDNNTLQNQIGQCQEQKANDLRKIDELNRELAHKDKALKDIELYVAQMLSNQKLQESRPNSLFKSLEENLLASNAKHQALLRSTDHLYAVIQQKEDMMQVLVNQETSLFDKIKALEAENKKVKEELGSKNEHIYNLKRTLASTRATNEYKLKTKDQLIKELKEELAEMNESDEEEEEEKEGPDEKDQQIKELQIEIAKLYMTVQRMEKQTTGTYVQAEMDNRPLIRKYVEEVECHKQTKLKHSEAQNLLKTSNAKNNELIETHMQKLKDKDTRIEHLELVMEDVRQNTAVAQKAWIDEKFYLERLIVSQREAMEMKDNTEIIIEADLAEAEKELKDAEDKAACLAIQLRKANERIIQLENERAGLLRRIEEREDHVGHEMDKLEAHFESLKIDYKMSEDQRQITETTLGEAMIQIQRLTEALEAQMMNSNIMKSEMQDQIESLKMQVASGEAKLSERDKIIAEMSKVAESMSKVYDNMFTDFSKLWDKKKEETEKVTKNQEQARTSSATLISNATLPNSSSTICQFCYCEGTFSFNSNRMLFCNVCGSTVDQTGPTIPNTEEPESQRCSNCHGIPSLVSPYVKECYPCGLYSRLYNNCQTIFQAEMDNRPLIRKYVEEVESHKQTKLKHSEAQNLLKTSTAKNNELIETHTRKLKDKDTRIEHLELVMEDVRQNTAVAQKAWIDEKFYLERLIASQREAMEMKDNTEIIIEADLAEAEKELKDAEDKAACLAIQLGEANERIIQLENERAALLRSIEETEEHVGRETDKLEAHFESLKIDYKMSEEQREDTETTLREAMIQMRDLTEALNAQMMNSNIMKSEMQDQIEQLKMQVARGEEKLSERDKIIAEMSKVAESMSKVYDTMFSDFSKLWDKKKEETEKVTNNQEQVGTSYATLISNATFSTSNSTICETCYCTETINSNGMLFCEACGSAVDQTVTKNEEQAGTSSATSTSTATLPTSNSAVCQNCWCKGTNFYHANGRLICNVCGLHQTSVNQTIGGPGPTIPEEPEPQRCSDCDAVPSVDYPFSGDLCYFCTLSSRRFFADFYNE